MTNFQFKLEKQAKKTGGDKYTCTDDSNFTIYLPQSSSRPNGKIIQSFKMVITAKKDVDKTKKRKLVEIEDEDEDEDEDDQSYSDSSSVEY